MSNSTEVKEAKKEVTKEVNKLSKMDKSELRDITKAYTDEEYLTVIKVIPDDYLWDELIRRDSAMLEKITYIQEVIGVSSDNLHPISARTWEDIRNRYDDLREKFSKIRKGFGK